MHPSIRQAFHGRSAVVGVPVPAGGSDFALAESGLCGGGPAVVVLGTAAAIVLALKRGLTVGVAFLGP